MFEVSLWLFLLALGLTLLGGAGVTGLVVAVRLFGRDDLERRPPWRAEDSAPPRRQPAHEELDDWPEELERMPRAVVPAEPPPPVAHDGCCGGCSGEEPPARVGLHEAGARPPAPAAPNGSYHLGTMGSLRPPPQPVLASGAAVFGRPQAPRQPPVPAGAWTP